mgnify:CR=1 FL=1
MEPVLTAGLVALGMALSLAAAFVPRPDSAPHRGPATVGCAEGAQAMARLELVFGAALRFGAVETPKVYYTVQVEKDGVTRTLKFKADGAAIKEFKLGGKS